MIDRITHYVCYGCSFLTAVLVLSNRETCGQDRASASLPNIVLIVTDDAGYADFGFQGSHEIQTPNMDSLRAAGVLFTSAYVTSSVCSPSRAGLLTGRYQQRFGHERNLLFEQHPQHGLSVSERTLADTLRERGYHTGAVGKWHLGYAPQFHPCRRGFDSFYGFLEGWRSYWPGESPGPRRMMQDFDSIHETFEYVTQDLGRASAQFIEDQRAGPFFLYLAFNAPHAPMHARQEDLKTVAGIDDSNRRTLAAMSISLDEAIGHVLQKLADCSLEENTVVLLINDNGGATDNYSENAPLRDHKGTTFEGGIRVPFVMRWPSKIQCASLYEHPVSSLDIFPTVLAAAGIPEPEDSQLDGVDLFPYLRGSRSDRPHDTLCWRRGSNWAIRRGDWKLVRCHLKPPLLFDLRQDIGETTDLAKQYPEVVQELASSYAEWESQMSPPAWDLIWPPPE